MTHALLEATGWGSGSRISQQDRKFARWIHSWVRIDDKTCREGGWRRNFAQTPRPVEQSRDANVRTLRSLTAGTDRSTRTQVIRSEVVYLTWPRRRTTRADLLKPFQTVRCYTTLYRAWRIATDSLAGAWLRAGRRYSPPLLFPVTPPEGATAEHWRERRWLMSPSVRQPQPYILYGVSTFGFFARRRIFGFLLIFIEGAIFFHKRLDLFKKRINRFPPSISWR